MKGSGRFRRFRGFWEVPGGFGRFWEVGWSIGVTQQCGAAGNGEG